MLMREMEMRDSLSSMVKSNDVMQEKTMQLARLLDESRLARFVNRDNAEIVARLINGASEDGVLNENGTSVVLKCNNDDNQAS